MPLALLRPERFDTGQSSRCSLGTSVAKSRNLSGHWALAGAACLARRTLQLRWQAAALDHARLSPLSLSPSEPAQVLFVALQPKGQPLAYQPVLQLRETAPAHSLSSGPGLCRQPSGRWLRQGLLGRRPREVTQERRLAKVGSLRCLTCFRAHGSDA